MTRDCMQNQVAAYTDAQKNVFAAFGCPPSYFIKALTDSPWRVTGGEDIHILSVNGQNAAVVRQDGQPMIFRAGGYALVIAIDCVKIAFLLDEQKELSS